MKQKECLQENNLQNQGLALRQHQPGKSTVKISDRN